MNAKVVKNLIKRNIKGSVDVGFIVNKRGEVERIEVLESPDEKFSKEVVRVIKSSSKWIPAVKNGKLRDCKVAISVNL